MLCDWQSKMNYEVKTTSGAWVGNEEIIQKAESFLKVVVTQQLFISNPGSAAASLRQTCKGVLISAGDSPELEDCSYIFL